MDYVIVYAMKSYGLCCLLTIDCLRYEKLWMMLTVDCLWYEKIVDLLVLYTMKILIDAMNTRSIIEPCHEMLMELDCIFMQYDT